MPSVIGAGIRWPFLVDNAASSPTLLKKVGELYTGALWDLLQRLCFRRMWVSIIEHLLRASLAIVRTERFRSRQRGFNPNLRGIRGALLR